jgi:hypothetical protein
MNNSFVPILSPGALTGRASVLGIALLAIAASGHAAPIAYNVNLHLNGCCGDAASVTGSVTGFIETDGTIGTLSAANIVDWSLKVSKTGAPDQFLIGPQELGYSISQSSDGSVLSMQGSDLSATESLLSFNTAAHQNGVFDICQYQCRWTSNDIFSIEDASENISQYSDIQDTSNYGGLISFNTYPGNDGELTVGMSATPEPSTWVFLATGLVCTGIALRRKRSGARVTARRKTAWRTATGAFSAVLLTAIFAPGARASTVNYTIDFTLVSGTPGAPTSGAFGYDADASIGSQFSGFQVTWDGINYDITPYANAPVSTGTDCGSTSADFFQLLSTGDTCSTQGSNEPEWFGDANARQNGNLFEFTDANAAGTSSLVVEESQQGRVGGSNAAYGTWTIEAVGAPEPATPAMILIGGALLGLAKMRRSRA